MKRAILTAAVLIAVAAGFLPAEPPNRAAAPATTDVLFSPKGGCADRIVREIEAAKESARSQFDQRRTGAI